MAVLKLSWMLLMLPIVMVQAQSDLNSSGTSSETSITSSNTISGTTTGTNSESNSETNSGTNSENSGGTSSENNVNLPLCDLQDADVSYTRNKLSPHLCLGITRRKDTDNTSSVSNEGTWRMQFQVKVDDFTQLRILGSSNQSWWETATHIWLEASGFNGYSAMKKRKLGDYTVPVWTLIIKIKEGKVIGMVWDDVDGCIGCTKGDDCIDGFCAIKSTECIGTDVCDLKVYIGWIGTDANGNYMTSAGRRLSQFRNYNLKSVFDVAYKSYSNEVPKQMRIG